MNDPPFRFLAKGVVLEAESKLGKQSASSLKTRRYSGDGNNFVTPILKSVESDDRRGNHGFHQALLLFEVVDDLPKLDRARNLTEHP